MLIFYLALFIVAVPQNSNDCKRYIGECHQVQNAHIQAICDGFAFFLRGFSRGFAHGTLGKTLHVSDKQGQTNKCP